MRVSCFVYSISVCCVYYVSNICEVAGVYLVLLLDLTKSVYNHNPVFLFTDTKIRSKAILTVRRWVPDHAEISPRVERFALETLNTLCDENPPSEPWPASPAPPAPTDDEDAAVPDAPSRREWTEQEVSRRIELFLALCGKRVDMLSE